jgi:porphobilinogen synthase
LRANNTLIDLVSESSISSNDLIQPLFIKENLKGTEAIDSMPEILRYSKESVIDEVEDLLEHKINTIALFPAIDLNKKDSDGTEALNKSNLICESIQKIKSKFPEMLVIADVALDPYTDHGHDGLLKNNYVDNDLTLDVLKSQSLILAESGADILAPSDMMDGRIGIIREALENADYKNTILLSYAAKYNSKFYGPFRDAVKSANNLGTSSKSSYQMSPTNKDEAIHEVAIDINEGADIVMVKPGMPYLDIISLIKNTFKVPTFAYQVSGEYSMLKLAINKGWLDRDVMLESLISFKRAGADAILTYAAKEISREINIK